MLCITVLQNEKANSRPSETGTTIKAKPVKDELIDAVVEPTIFVASTDSNIDVRI